MKFLARIIVGAAIATAATAGCGTTPGSEGPSDGGPGGGDAKTYEGGSFFMPPPDQDATTSDASGLGPQGTLTVMPLTPIVAVTTGMAPPTVSFTGYVGGTATGVAWSLDRGELGTISAAGVFTPSGNIAGTGTITATYGSQTATTTITVKISTTQSGDPAWSATPTPPGAGGYGGVGGDGPGPAPTAAQMTALGTVPTADSTVAIIYPYTGTVWPQGLLAPLLQWKSGTHSFDSVYVDIQEKNYEYKGYFGANATPFDNLPIPQAAWDAATFSNSGDALTLSVVFSQNGASFGPYTETWIIAQATMKGTIYYNSYGTSLVHNSNSDDSYGNQYGAGTLAIAPGATSPTLTAGVNSVNATGDGTGCRVCHTVSADGKSLVTQASNASASDYSDTVYINLAMDTTAGAGTSLAPTKNLAFPALYKDGSLLFSSAGGMIDGDGHSQLYSMPAGTAVTGVTGLGTNLKAALPAFSPDGQHVSFNFWSGSLVTGPSTLGADGGADAGDAGDAGAGDAGAGDASPGEGGAPAGVTLNGDNNSLAILDFDGTSVFSNPRILYTPPGGEAVTYSSFEPNSSGVVFEVELANPSGSWGYTWNNNTGELWWLDVASQTAHRLDALNGYDTTGAAYLPDNQGDGGAATHAATQEPTLNYEPTVNPIASGGYAWVVFTSRRMYGNVAQLKPWVSDPRNYPWLDEVTDKKLWVAAIDLNAAPGTDPSHPAFYLPAQELHAGNSRGYWTVEACHADGISCQTGDQCCGGYCQATDAGLICSSQKPMCAALYDKCTQTSDCCGAGQGVTCINSICSTSSPPAPAQ